MSGLLDEKALTGAEREVYGAILEKYLKKENAAPNLLVSLDGMDDAERAKVRQVVDKNQETCQLVQLQEPVVVGPKYERYAHQLIACYCQQSPFPWKLKMDRSAYPQVDPAVVQEFRQKLPSLVKQVTFIDFPAVGMKLSEFVRDAARIRQEIQGMERVRVCFIDFECYTDFVISEVGMAVVELSRGDSVSAQLVDKYHRFAQFNRTLFKNGAPNWTSLKYVKKRVTGIPYDGQKELRALDISKVEAQMREFHAKYKPEFYLAKGVTTETTILNRILGEEKFRIREAIPFIFAASGKVFVDVREKRNNNKCAFHNTISREFHCALDDAMALADALL